MTTDNGFHADRFPRASAYHAEWVLAGASSAAKVCGLPNGSPRRSTSDPVVSVPAQYTKQPLLRSSEPR